MPQIMPFRGIRFNRDKIRDLSTVVAPPYDVISKAQQDSLYRSSPYNIVRVELARIKPSDNRKDNRYIRAAKSFGSWLESGMMIRDDRESLYFYSQQYKNGGKTVERPGFMAVMALDDSKGKKVLPHENTLMAPKVDRFELTRNVRANLSPIYVLYDDAGAKISGIMKDWCSRRKPFMDINFEGIRNRAWKVDDQAVIRKISRLMSGKDTFIADGHHRYEVSRMYARELSSKGASPAARKAAGGLMVYFVASDEKILTVLPAHRLPRDIGRLTKEDVLSKLSEYFDIYKASGVGSMLGRMAKLRGSHAFGLYLGGGKFYVMVLKDVRESDRAIKDKPKDWRRLDVSILHRFIFGHILGISDSDDNVEFVKSPQETARLVDKGWFKVAFFLNPTKVSEIKRIARLGERMPRKATYFYPKPISGVVINPLWSACD